MSIPLKVIMSNDLFTAYLDKTENFTVDIKVTTDELKSLLKEKRVVYGIKEDKLKELVLYPHQVSFPLLVAEGRRPVNGEDGYFVYESKEKKEEKEEKINFRNVMDIPSVKSGEVIARIIPPTKGVNGMDVTGREIQASDGKPAKIRPGKNVNLNENEFISLIDGQVSITNHVISVNPVFEVRGDVDMKVGNINFVGNVVIHGNVPTGYQIVAGGDIKVYGLVEGAQLVSKGNIFITGGITGGNKAKIAANGTIQASYFNQADVSAGQDVIISSSCLHSKISAKGSIDGRNAHIIGGSLFSEKDILVKKLGNHLYTKTEVTVGYVISDKEEENKLREEKEQILSSIQKLQMIENKILNKQEEISPQEKRLLIKQRMTKKQFERQLEDIQMQLDRKEQEKKNIVNCHIVIYDKVYPNTVLRFGNHVKMIQHEHSYVKFFVKDKEIVFEPIT